MSLPAEPAGHRAIRPQAPFPGGTSQISVEINFDFPADLCQQQQRDCCTIPCLVAGKESLHESTTTGHRSNHSQYFCLPKPLFKVGYYPMDPVFPLFLIQRSNSKPYPSAPAVFANSRFTAFGCTPQQIQGLLSQDP